MSSFDKPLGGVSAREPSWSTLMDARQPGTEVQDVREADDANIWAQEGEEWSSMTIIIIAAVAVVDRLAAPLRAQ
jgi:hypothetical protein